MECNGLCGLGCNCGKFTVVASEVVKITNTETGKTIVLETVNQDKLQEFLDAKPLPEDHWLVQYKNQLLKKFGL